MPCDQYRRRKLCGARRRHNDQDKAVTRRAPHNSGGHITHTVLILDVWRRSAREDKGAELVGKESSVPAADITAAKAYDRGTWPRSRGACHRGDRAGRHRIYGAVSFTANQRTRDLGIRVALGATRAHIIREVFTSGGKPVAPCLIAGMWLAVPTAAGLRESVRGLPYPDRRRRAAALLRGRSAAGERGDAGGARGRADPALRLRRSCMRRRLRPLGLAGSAAVV